MMTLLRTMLIVAIVGAGTALLAPEPAQANDRYWNNYWSWYDSSYRPYNHRQYRNHYNDNRDFGFQDNPSYRQNYYRPYSGYGYNYPYRSRNALRGRQNSVEVNGFRFHWR